ncbi:protein MpHD21 [Marchantia polymorpha subsp. ruderalis]
MRRSSGSQSLNLLPPSLSEGCDRDIEVVSSLRPCFDSNADAKPYHIEGDHDPLLESQPRNEVEVERYSGEEDHNPLLDFHQRNHEIGSLLLHECREQQTEEHGSPMLLCAEGSEVQPFPQGFEEMQIDDKEEEREQTRLQHTQLDGDGDLRELSAPHDFEGTASRMQLETFHQPSYGSGDGSHGEEALQLVYYENGHESQSVMEYAHLQEQELALHQYAIANQGRANHSTCEIENEDDTLHEHLPEHWTGSSLHSTVAETKGAEYGSENGMLFNHLHDQQMALQQYAIQNPNDVILQTREDENEGHRLHGSIREHFTGSRMHSEFNVPAERKGNFSERQGLSTQVMQIDDQRESDLTGGDTQGLQDMGGWMDTKAYPCDEQYHVSIGTGFVGDVHGQAETSSLSAIEREVSFSAQLAEDVVMSSEEAQAHQGVWKSLPPRFNQFGSWMPERGISRQFTTAPQSNASSYTGGSSPVTGLVTPRSIASPTRIPQMDVNQASSQLIMGSTMASQWMGVSSYTPNDFDYGVSQMKLTQSSIEHAECGMSTLRSPSELPVSVNSAVDFSNQSQSTQMPIDLKAMQTFCAGNRFEDFVPIQEGAKVGNMYLPSFHSPAIVPHLNVQSPSIAELAPVPFTHAHLLSSAPMNDVPRYSNLEHPNQFQDIGQLADNHSLQDSNSVPTLLQNISAETIQAAALGLNWPRGSPVIQNASDQFNSYSLLQGSETVGPVWNSLPVMSIDNSTVSPAEPTWNATYPHGAHVNQDQVQFPQTLSVDQAESYARSALAYGQEAIGIRDLGSHDHKSTNKELPRAATGNIQSVAEQLGEQESFQHTGMGSVSANDSHMVQGDHVQQVEAGAWGIMPSENDGVVRSEEVNQLGSGVYVNQEEMCLDGYQNHCGDLQIQELTGLSADEMNYLGYCESQIESVRNQAGDMLMTNPVDGKQPELSQSGEGQPGKGAPEPQVLSQEMERLLSDRDRLSTKLLFWKRARFRARLITHPLFPQLLKAHVDCIRVMTPASKIRDINLQLVQAQKFFEFFLPFAPKCPQPDDFEFDYFLENFLVRMKHFQSKLEMQLKVHTTLAYSKLWRIERVLVDMTGQRIPSRLDDGPLMSDNPDNKIGLRKAVERDVASAVEERLREDNGSSSTDDDDLSDSDLDTDIQNADDPDLPCADNPSEQYSDDANVEFMDDPSLQNAGGANVQYEDDPRLQNAGGAIFQYGNDPSFQSAGVPDGQYEHDPSLQNAGGPDVQHGDDPSLQNAGGSDVQYDHDPSLQNAGGGIIQYGGDPSLQNAGGADVQYDHDHSLQNASGAIVQYGGDPSLQNAGGPDVQYEHDPSLQNSGGAIIQYGDRTSLENTGGANVQYVDFSSLQCAAGASFQYGDYPSLQNAGGANFQCVDDPSLQYAGGANVQYTDNPNIQYTGDPNVQFVDDANLQYGGDSSVQYTGNPNFQYTGDPNVQFVDDHTFQFGGDFNLQFADDQNLQYTGDPNLPFADDPNEQYGDDPNVQYVDDPDVQSADDPNSQCADDADDVEHAGDPDVQSAMDSDYFGTTVPDRAVMESIRRELIASLGFEKYKKKIKEVRDEILRKRRAGKLPDGTTQILKAWWDAHSKWPYPTEDEKEVLLKTTGLELKQINNWFINQRKRNWHNNPLSSSNKEKRKVTVTDVMQE